MKKLIFTNCILAIAVIFTYCAKPDLKEELSAANTDQVAANRGTCTLVNSPGNINTTITICGTNTNKTNCVQCNVGNVSTGVETFIGSLFSLQLQTPITISISNTNQTALNLTAGNNTLPTINMPANSCRRFHIDDNCFITAL